MKTKKQNKTEGTTPSGGSPFVSVLVGTLLNMTLTVTTAGSVLLCLVVAKHFA